MSAPNKDKKNRLRSKTIAFRSSPEEAEEIEKRWKLCGYSTKQDYILDSVLNQQVIAKGNPRMLIQFRTEISNILEELRRIQTFTEMDDEILISVRTMLEILEAFALNEDIKDKKTKRQFMERRRYRHE